MGSHPVAVVQYTFGSHPVAAVQYKFGNHPLAAVQYTFGSHPLAAVQYTFTHKEYTEQHNETEYNTYITTEIKGKQR